MSDKLSTLTATDIAEFKTREAKAISSLKQSADSYQEFTSEFVAICKRELWRAKYKTKEDFISGLRDLIGVSRSQFFKKIHAEEIRFQLAKNLKSQSETKNVKSLAKEVDSMSTEALLEIGKASPDQRPKVFEKAAQIGPVTKPSIAAARKIVDKTEVKDDAGYPIPPDALMYWEKRHEIQERMTAVSQTKCALEKARQEDDPLYRRISQGAIDYLSRAYQFISDAKPYAVCLTCQGRLIAKCPVCRGTGLVSESMYAHKEAEEKRIIREKAYNLRPYA